MSRRLARISRVGGLALLLLAAAPVAASLCEVPPQWRNTRPDPPGQATPVEVVAFVLDLLSINDSQQSYRADFFLYVTWKDPRLVAGDEMASLAGCSLPLDELWTPQLVFLAFGEALRTSYLANRDQEERALKIDRISRLLFPSLFVLVLIISFVV